MKIYIENIAERIEGQNEEWKVYLNKRTGQFEVISDEYKEIAKKLGGNNDINTYKEWEKAYINIASEIINNNEYVQLPYIYEIDEISVMRDFANSLEDEEKKNIIIKAISEEGAIRRFKDTVENLKLVDEWTSFRGKVYYRIAIDFCKNEGIECSWLNRNNSEK